MIAIVNYGVGNLFSLESSFRKIGYDVNVTSDANEILCASRIILPGVGAFGDAAEKLFASGLDVPLKNAAFGKKVPLLGICVGMQLLFDRSFEFGEHVGLGFIPGSVRAISEVLPKDSGLKIPQIGWNALIINQDQAHDPLLKNIPDGSHVYFVHSYAAFCERKYVSSEVEYGALLTASVRRENIFGVQFHPEKSGEVGLQILRNFCEMGVV